MGENDKRRRSRRVTQAPPPAKPLSGGYYSYALDHPAQEANYPHWAKVDLWAQHEAILLLLAVEPMSTDRLRTLYPDLYEKFSKIRHLAAASEATGRLKPFDYVGSQPRYVPGKWIDWAQRKGILVPEALVEAISPTHAIIANENRCKQWFRDLVKGPKQKTKKQYFEEAKLRFSGLSRNGFDRIWNELAPAEWRYAGRRSRHLKSST